MTSNSPRLFISYSWSSPDHEQWVLDLAIQLVENGVDVVLDKWQLKEGHDVNNFMEKMVKDPNINKVAIICDGAYARKADDRKGGVGTETQIISSEVYSKADQNKFVAIIAERDEKGNPYLPIYYKSRVYIDLSSSDKYSLEFEKLLRWVFDKPLYVKPPLGKIPAFLAEETGPSLRTTFKYSRVSDAIQNGRAYASGALNDYFETFSENLEQFRIKMDSNESDEQVIQSIEQFIPYRNEVIYLTVTLAQYSNTKETWEKLHKFLEKLMSYLDSPPGSIVSDTWDYDNFRFIIHELFLYMIAAFLKYECYDAVGYLLRQYYYDPRGGSSQLVSFPSLHRGVYSLVNRNKRLGLNRVSIRADLLKQRAETSGLFPFVQIMQADFVLLIRSYIDMFRNSSGYPWFPETLLYAGSLYVPFEIFARSRSKEYFTRIQAIFDISRKEELDQLIQAFQDGNVELPRIDRNLFSPLMLMGYKELSTKP